RPPGAVLRAGGPARPTVDGLAQPARRAPARPGAAGLAPARCALPPAGPGARSVRAGTAVGAPGGRGTRRRPGPAGTQPAFQQFALRSGTHPAARRPPARSEEHTSELQSRENLVCRLLLEKT